jgi:hypothetical protein
MKEYWTRVLSTIFMAAIAAGIYCGTIQPGNKRQNPEIPLETIVKK